MQKAKPLSRTTLYSQENCIDQNTKLINALFSHCMVSKQYEINRQTFTLASASSPVLFAPGGSVAVPWPAGHCPVLNRCARRSQRTPSNCSYSRQKWSCSSREGCGDRTGRAPDAPEVSALGGKCRKGHASNVKLEQSKNAFRQQCNIQYYEQKLSTYLVTMWELS